jgi:hypothetical protein
MTPKGANLQATDLLEISEVSGTGYITKSITGQEIINAASGGGGSGTVTSVDLTMPSAFTVTGNPITTSGTLAVAGAGVATQYIRGDGQLANFPTSSGGGASVSYYLNGSVNQGTFGGVAMKELNKTPVIGAGTDFTINTNGYIQSFITDANDPNQLEIPGGNWNFETYFSASSPGGTPSFYIELYKWDGATLTLIASSSATPEGITNGTAIDLYLTALAVPQTTLALTDRLAVRIYVNNSGRTIKLHTEDNHLSQVITTFSTGLTALNGLTAQVQNLAVGTSGTDFAISSAASTHIFNLPTASATNRGALSSADWTVFNNKQNTLNQASILSLLGFWQYNRVAETSAITGTIVESIIENITIPANTYLNGGILRLYNLKVRKVGAVGVTTAMKIYIGPNSNNLSGATQIGVLSGTLFAGSLFFEMLRTFTCTTTSLLGLSFTASSNTDTIISTVARSSTAVDWTVNQYIIITIQAASISDSYTMIGASAKNF